MSIYGKIFIRFLRHGIKEWHYWPSNTGVVQLNLKCSGSFGSNFSSPVKKMSNLDMSNDGFARNQNTHWGFSYRKFHIYFNEISDVDRLRLCETFLPDELDSPSGN